MVIGCIFSVAAPESVLAESADAVYFKAEACYLSLLKTPEKLQYRDNWFPCIDQFENAYKADPRGPYAAAALYMTGKLFQELYHISYKKSDKDKAVEHYKKIIQRYSKSDYVKKAREGLIEMSGADDISKILNDNPEKKVRKEMFKASKANYKKRAQDYSGNKKDSYSKPSYAKPEYVPDSGEKIHITGLRVWSNPSYTRVVIDADGNTAYTHRLLDEDPSINKPKRLYIDFDNSILNKDVENIVSINDDMLKTARAAQNDPSSVRVVIDIKSFETYKIFSLRNPSRTIIDVWGTGSGTNFASAGNVKKKVVPVKPKKEIKTLSNPEFNKSVKEARVDDLADQLNLGVRRIVIDPGHGGRDVGAVGYGIYEKDIVLSIARRLKREIEGRLKGCEVIMTRSSDVFLGLEERTAIANTQNADLFLSLHTNAHQNKNAYGVETYFLNLADDDESKMVAKRENAATSRNLSDLEAILLDLIQTTKINESSHVAAHVQRSMCKRLEGKYSKIKNKGVKRAPFYVLIGANMPSILIETSFISNQRECKRLMDSKYQEQLARGIVEGIINYLRARGPTAFNRSTKGRSS